MTVEELAALLLADSEYQRIIRRHRRANARYQRVVRRPKRISTKGK